MKISEPTIQALAEIIRGGDDDKKLGYKSGPNLVKFFYPFDSKDIYGPSFPSRKEYTIQKIKEYNGTTAIYEIIKLAFPSLDLDKETPETASIFNNSLRKDGYQLIPLHSKGLVDDTGYITYGNFLEFDIRPTNNKTVEINTIIEFNHSFIQEQITKAKSKLTNTDYDGAITNARSLVEAFQEEILRKNGSEIPKHDGDLQKLYKETKKALNLEVSKDLDDTLKQILAGLNSIISGVGGLSNKMGDRHSRSYKPAKHHAKLAVNTAFTFCEFLLDSFEYQKNRNSKKCKESQY
jgi:hypothetical protein